MANGNPGDQFVSVSRLQTIDHGLDTIRDHQEYMRVTSADLLIDHGFVAPSEELAAAAEVASAQAAEAIELDDQLAITEAKLNAILDASDVVRTAAKHDAVAKAETLLATESERVEADLDMLQAAEPSTNRSPGLFWLLRDAYDQLFPVGLGDANTYDVSRLPRMLAVLRSVPLEGRDGTTIVEALEDVLAVLIPDESDDEMAPYYIPDFYVTSVHNLDRLRAWLDTPEPYAP